MRTILKYTAAAILLVSLFALAGCEKDTDDGLAPEKKTFLDKAEYGLYISGNDTFVYSDVTHQIAVSPTHNSVRLQQDDMERYMQLAFDGQLVKDGSVTANIVFKNLVQSVTSTSLTVLELSSDRVWLWDEASMTGYLIPLAQ